jgi:HAE1 family hydrophobic/amphiphilic exporter-1
VSSGAGSAARRSLGTAVFGGMLVATALTLALVPALYVIIQGAAERVRLRPRTRGRLAERGAEEGATG